MAVSVAIARALFDLYGLVAGIKWPNDLLINEKKICGILMEISAEVDRLEYVVVGIGINANVDVSDFPEEWKTTSLRQELGREVSRFELIQRILQEIEDAYERMDSKEIYEEWRRSLCHLGTAGAHQLHLRRPPGRGGGPGRGRCPLIRRPRGLHRVLAGDCIHLRALEECMNEEKKDSRNCQGHAAVHPGGLPVLSARWSSQGSCRPRRI